MPAHEFGAKFSLPQSTAELTSPSLVPKERLERPWQSCVAAIETLVRLARTLPPQSDSGDWGQWDFAEGMWEGTLYVPFGSNAKGLAQISFLNNRPWAPDLRALMLTQAIALWEAPHQTPTMSRSYKRMAITIPYYAEENYPKTERQKLRQFFFYQETVPDALVLTALGSEATGYLEAQGVRPRAVKREVGTYKERNCRNDCHSPNLP